MKTSEPVVGVGCVKGNQYLVYWLRVQDNLWHGAMVPIELS